MSKDEGFGIDMRPWQTRISDLERQLAQSREREAALQKLISAQDEQLLLLSRERDTEKARREKAEVECFDLSVDLDNMSRAAENLLVRAEKAESEADRVRAVALKQYEYALEESARLRDASLPVAKQLDEPIVMGADGVERCRLVPAGLLLTLREALAAKPKAPRGRVDILVAACEAVCSRYCNWFASGKASDAANEYYDSVSVLRDALAAKGDDNDA